MTNRVALITSQDCLEQLLDSCGGSGTDGLLIRRAKRSLQQGLLELNAHRRWNYSRRNIVLPTNDTYQTGTITYTNSTRTVTLASGTWPTWAGRGWLLISNKTYRIETRSSGTSVILAENSNPGANVAAGTSYVIFCPAYLLPFDCASVLEAFDATSRYPLAGVPPAIFEQQYLSMYQTGSPQYFTVTGDDWTKGAMCIKFYPIPASGRQISYYYDRTQQPLRIWKYNTGTVTVSASSTSVTGTSTAFTQSMVGAVIRFGTPTTEPTSLEGSSPALEERVILSVESATALTLDQAVDSAYSAAKYYVSDLVDLEPLAQRTALINCSGLHFARERNADSAELQRRSTAFVDALKLAMEADKRQPITDYGFGHGIGGFPIAHSPTNAGYYA